MDEKTKQKYYELTSRDEQLEMARINSNETKPEVKFYLWDYCVSYGWRQMGRANGYDSAEELKEDSTWKFNEKEGNTQRIMKAVLMEVQ